MKYQLESYNGDAVIVNQENWYPLGSVHTQHVPNLLQVEGVHKCTRFRLEQSSNEGMARYAAIYEVDAPNIHETEKWRRQADIECEWMTKIRPNTYNRTFTSFRKVG